MIVYKTNEWKKGVIFGDNNLMGLPKNTDIYTYKKIKEEELEEIKTCLLDELDLILNKYI